MRLPRSFIASLVALVVMVAATSCRVVDPGPGQTIPLGSTRSASPTRTDVAYVTGGELGCASGNDEECGGSQTLDVYRAPGAGTHPVVIYLHAGGWIAGDKSAIDTESSLALRQLDRGFDVISVNYRLANGKTDLFPTGLLDVKTAVRWVKANADELEIDPERIIAMGHSAGGNFAQLLATTSGVPGLEPLGLPADLAAEDSSVAGAVSIAGISSFFDLRSDGHAWSWSLILGYFGCYNTCDLMLLVASPLTWVSADDAPIYGIYGRTDSLAFPHSGTAMEAAYARAGVGASFWLDVVDSGPGACQSHNPHCGVNMPSLDLFIDAVS